MRANSLMMRLFSSVVALCVFHAVEAGSPVWIFTPLTATTISVQNNDTASVQYQVTNQSTRRHTLVMNGITGVTQLTSGVGVCANPFTLSGHSSCTLSLQIDGRQITAGNTDGPVVCEQGNPLQCYRPSSADTLSVHVTHAPNTTTLSVTPSTLTLSVTGLTTTTGNNSGTPRVFTIQNTGPETAMGVTCPTSLSGSIASITCTGCGTILSGGVCTATITPSATPSAAVGDTSATPITLTIQGTNTNTLSPTVNVLTYGSFYQAGWLFSIIETANTSLSIGGTVAAESDNADQGTTEYSLDGANTTTAMYSSTDGAANSEAMVTQYGVGTYSASVCTIYTGGGYTDWYLPAICQMGFGGEDINFICGVSPGIIPNMQYNLLVTNLTQTFNFVNNGGYWSSTASDDGGFIDARFQRFSVGSGDGYQGGNGVDSTYGIRCVRAIT